VSAEVNAILKTPATRDRLIALGAEPKGGTPQQFADFISAETAKWGAVIKAANIKAE